MMCASAVFRSEDTNYDKTNGDRCNMTTQPNEQTSLSQWLEYIAGIHVSAIDMGLERVLPVAKRLGVLKDQLTRTPYVFTVAGTNGKGSTTATIAAICRQAGLKTALYQSPHLVSFTERISVDGQHVSEQALVSALWQVEQARLECGLTLSFFEMTTLAAFLLFKNADCDVWVLEIGLGGRLDVVNIIDPDLAVITNIGIDHVDWLGDDIEKIGAEKAGIIRDGIQVVLGSSDLPQSVYDAVLKSQAISHQLGRDFDFREDGQSWQYSSSAITLNLPRPKLSLLNAVNAVTAVLASGLPISHDDVAQALAQVRLAGRFDHRTIKGRQWLFDVAHNGHGMAFLLSQFVPFWKQYQQDKPDAKIHMVFSMLGDKDVASVLSLLSAAIKEHRLPVQTWQIAPIDHVRASRLDEIERLMQSQLPTAKTTSHKSLGKACEQAMDVSTAEDLVLVFGSFHTVSEALMALTGIRY